MDLFKIDCSRDFKREYKPLSMLMKHTAVRVFVLVSGYSLTNWKVNNLKEPKNLSRNLPVT